MPPGMTRTKQITGCDDVAEDYIVQIRVRGVLILTRDVKVVANGLKITARQ